MQVYLPLYELDVPICKVLFDSLRSLPGMGRGHDLTILFTRRISDEIWKRFADQMGSIESCEFSQITLLRDELPQGPYYASNEAFKWMCRLAEQDHQIFLYIEPDCLFNPKINDPLGILEDAFQRSGMSVLGKMTFVPYKGLHINGVAIYGPETWSILADDLNGMDISKPFDDILRHRILPVAAPTNLIQQLPKCAQLEFVEGLDPSAVIYHGCKDDSLWKLIKP